MQLKSIAKVTDTTKLFNNIVSSGVISNLAFKNALAGLDVQTKINIVSQSTLNRTQMIGALASSGLTKEELKDAIAKLDDAIATNALSDSQKDAIISTLGLDTAFKGLGISIKSTAKSMLTWMASLLFSFKIIITLQLTAQLV